MKNHHHIFPLPWLNSDFCFPLTPEGIGPKVDKFELLRIASKDKRHFIRIKSEKDLDKALDRAVDTSIGELILSNNYYFTISWHVH